MRYAAYDPLAFLNNPSTAPLVEDTNAKGCFTFSSITPPSTGLLAITVQDPSGTSPAQLQLTAVGASVVAGQSYKVDVFSVSKSQVSTWSSQSAVDYDAKGAYVALFYDAPVPPSTDLEVDETKPVSGVSLLESGAAPAGVKYFSTGRDQIGSATSTSAVGGAIAPAPPSIDVYSGSGGERGKATLDGRAEALIQRLAERLKAHPQLKRIRVEGHADPSERDAARLSQARADVVRARLIARGVDADRLQAVGYGAERPIDQRKTAEARARNRRVELVIVEQ